jgi:N-acetylneuraminic acid mutarotase
VRRVVLGASAAWLLAATTVLAAPPVGVGEWEGRPPSAVAREEGSFVEVGGRFYLAFGRDDLTQEVYDPATGTWTTAGTVPENLSHVQGVEVGGRIYYPGGFAFGPRRDVGTMHIYDPATGGWSTGASMPAGRERGAGGVAAVAGKIYYVGGLRLPQVAVPWVDVYDTATDTWSTLPDMPRARDHVAVAAMDGAIYAIGGRVADPASSVAATDRYDISAGAWTAGLAPLPTPRAGAAAAPLGQELVVIGGSHDYVSLRTVEAYDVANDAWRTLAPMPTARDGIQAVVFDGEVYVAGGGTVPRGTGPTDVLEVYIPTSTVRPDALVKLSTAAAMLGGDVWNLTGLGQTATSIAAPGQTRTFKVRIENDGSTLDAYTVKAPSASPGFAVRYLRGATGTVDITAAVLAGTYTTASLTRGASVVMRVRIQVKSGAPAGATQAIPLTIASLARPSSTDVVKAVVQRM